MRPAKLGRLIACGWCGLLHLPENLTPAPFRADEHEGWCVRCHVRFEVFQQRRTAAAKAKAVRS